MANKPLHFTQVKKSKNPPVRILSRFGCFDFTRCPEPDMRRAFLVCGVLYTLASRSTARSAAALFSRRSPPSSAHRYAAIRRKFRQQQRLSTGRETEATKMHFRRATFGGRRLLSLSTRAAFAASAGTYTLPRYPNEPGRDVEMWRNLGSWSGRPSKFAGGWWRPVSHPALSRAAASSSSRTGGDFALGAVDLRTVDGGPIPEESMPAALKAWPWKNSQGILVSPLDKRQYRWLRLENGLQVLVISDPGATKAAAAMTVDVGAASDPPDLPGLAHFLEHMLFLGTSKYPLENAYKAFLSKHGGISNASTAMDVTTYQFEVGGDHLKGALDIFAQFFVSPLFSESNTERELKAVDSEDSKNRINDSRRILQVLKAIADPDHPYAKFSTGNLKTLKEDVPDGIDTRRELIAFHAKHYKAPNMALVVLGKEDLHHLEALARECFDEVKGSSESTEQPSAEGDSRATTAAATRTVHDDKGEAGLSGLPVNVEDDAFANVAERLAATMRSPWDTPPAMMVDMEPLRKYRNLMIQWPMPPVQGLWRSSPTGILSHVLGHEGPGSLFAALQDKGLATAVSAGLRTTHDNFSLFQVRVTLTKEGQKRWEDVAAMVHAHVRLVKNMPLEEAQRVWREARDMDAIYLRFRQEVSPYRAVPGLSRRLLLYPPNEVLSAWAVLDREIDPALLSAFADYLTPENTLTWRVWQREKNSKSDDVKGIETKRVVEDGQVGSTEKDSSGNGEAVEAGRGETGAHERLSQLLEERWYGVKYGAFPTPSELLEAWNDPKNAGLTSMLKLPGPNAFIPDDFSLVCDRNDFKQGGVDDSVQGMNEVATHGDGEDTEAFKARGQGSADGIIKPPALLETGGDDGVAKEGQLWHRLDASFRQPRSYVRFVLGTPAIKDGGATASQNARIMTDIIEKVMAQRTYDAAVAGLGWTIERHPTGYYIQVSGFSQKVAPLLQQVVEAFLDPVEAAGGPEAFEKQFDIAKERAIRGAKNWAMNRPDEIANYYNRQALKVKRKKAKRSPKSEDTQTDETPDITPTDATATTHPASATSTTATSTTTTTTVPEATSREIPDEMDPDPGRLKAAEATSLEGCLSLHKDVLSRMIPVGLVYGNASPEDAKMIWKTMIDQLDGAGCQPLPEEDYPTSRMADLPRGKRVNLRVNGTNKEDPNSSTVAYWQLGRREEQKFATLLLLSQMMREPCFTELRTKQQIGYIVSSGVRSYGRSSRLVGFSVSALSKTMGPDDICERIDAFLPQFRQTLVDMPQEDFDTHVKSMIKRHLEPPKKASAEFGTIAGEVFSGDLKWDRKAAMVERLASVSREDLLNLLDNDIMCKDKAKRMNVMVYGKDHPRPALTSEGDERTIELRPSNLKEFSHSLDVQDYALTPQAALADALARGSP